MGARWTEKCWALMTVWRSEEGPEGQQGRGLGVGERAEPQGASAVAAGCVGVGRTARGGGEEHSCGAVRGPAAWR